MKTLATCWRSIHLMAWKSKDGKSTAMLHHPAIPFVCISHTFFLLHISVLGSIVASQSCEAIFCAILNVDSRFQHRPNSPERNKETLNKLQTRARSQISHVARRQLHNITIMVSYISRSLANGRTMHKGRK